MTTKATLSALLISAMMLVALCIASTGSMTESGASPAEMNIVQTAVAAGNFSMLVIAVQEAGLEETLSGPGPFTVFAPTDDAFAKIPAEQLTALLGNKTELTAVLTYHVVSGNVMSKNLSNEMMVPTVQGENLTITTTDGVMVNNARVVQADIVCSNGIIHVIDTVLMP